MAAVAATVAAGCGSSSKTAAPTSATSGKATTDEATTGKTLTIGVINSETGAIASGYATTQVGIESRLGLANASGGVDGYKIKYVIADDASTPQGALSAAQDLVQRDKVFAIITESPLFIGAANYTTSVGVPVISMGQDSFNYANPANKNLFSATGSTGQNTVDSTFGKYWKAQGVTNLAVVGYSDSPSSSISATDAAKSAKAAGIKVGYTNTDLPLGTTNVGPIVLGMKNAGVNGVWLPIEENTSFAILSGLQQNGVKLKSGLLPTGYGGDLLASSSTVQSAQGYQFSTFGAPVELNTPATKTFAAALAKYGKSNGVPTYAEYAGWLITDLFLFGLKSAGQDPTHSSYISKLRSVTSYNAGGLLPASINFTQYGDQEEGTVGNCFFAVTLKSSTFEPIASASPICGTLISK